MFKKNFNKLLNDKFELEGFGNLFDIYMAHLVQTYDSEIIEKLEYKEFGNFVAEDVFPDEKEIRLYVAKDINALISENSFKKRKAYILVSQTIAKSPFPDELKEKAWLEVFGKYTSEIMPDESEILNNPKIPSVFKKNIINVTKLLKASANIKYHPETTIEICENLLKENENNIKAMELLIYTYFSMGSSKYKEVIFYYDKMCETEKKLKDIEAKIGNTFNSSDLNQKELIKEKLSFTNALPGMSLSELIKPRHTEAITAFAAAIEGKYEMSLDLLCNECIDNLYKLKEQGIEIPDSYLYYPKEDKNYVILARVISNLALSKDERMIKKANELREAFLNNNFEELEKVIIAFEKSPEITRNIAKE